MSFMSRVVKARKNTKIGSNAWQISCYCHCLLNSIPEPILNREKKDTSLKIVNFTSVSRTIRFDPFFSHRLFVLPRLALDVPAKLMLSSFYFCADVLLRDWARQTPLEFVITLNHVSFYHPYKIFLVWNVKFIFIIAWKWCLNTITSVITHLQSERSDLNK